MGMQAHQVPLVACAIGVIIGVLLLIVKDDETADGIMRNCLGKIIGFFLTIGCLIFGVVLLITQGWPF
jgi:hypothetical protein